MGKVWIRIFGKVRGTGKKWTRIFESIERNGKETRFIYEGIGEGMRLWECPIPRFFATLDKAAREKQGTETTAARHRREFCTEKSP